MTLFASKTPRDLNHDLMPWVYWYDDRRLASPVDHNDEFDPRPEFDHVQHNEPNPILVDFRKYAKTSTLSVSDLAAHWTQTDEMWREVTLSCEVFSLDEPMGTPEQEDHARRVLERLARLAALEG